MVVQHYYDLDYRVRRKAEALIEAGYEVDVLALRPQGKPSTYTVGGANVRSISLGKKRGSLSRYAFEYIVFFLWAFCRLTVQMRSRKYVMVDINTLPDFLVFTAIVPKWMGAKVMLDMHEITPEFYMSKYEIQESSWLIRLLKFQEQISFDFADHVITISEPIQALFLSRGLEQGKSTVIMNSADESRFVESVAESRDRGAAKSAEAYVMMYHGTLTKIYGLDVAVEAFSLVHQDMPAAELWLLGSGTEVETLKTLARERGIESKVKLIGQVPPSDIPAWLNKCDVGVLPFHRDVFLEFASPNKLPEFIVMGKPVIMSRLKATRYYFSEDALAFFEPDQPGDMAKQMLCLYRDPQLRRKLAAKAREEYAAIRWDVMKQRYLKQVATLVGPLATSASATSKEMQGFLR